MEQVQPGPEATAEVHDVRGEKPKWGPEEVSVDGGEEIQSEQRVLLVTLK